MCLPFPIIYFTEFDRRRTGPVKGIGTLPDAEASVPIAALQLQISIHAIHERTARVFEFNSLNITLTWTTRMPWSRYDARREGDW